MTNTPYADPIQSLYSYIYDIKPYHTKIVEVLVNLVYDEQINVTVLDNLNIELHHNIDMYANPCMQGFDTDVMGAKGFGGPEYRYSIDNISAPAWCRAGFDTSEFDNGFGEPGYEDYISPTTIAPTFTDEIKFYEMLPLHDSVQAKIYDWTNRDYLLDNVGYDLDAYGITLDQEIPTIFFDDNWFDIYGFDTSDVLSSITLIESINNAVDARFIDSTLSALEMVEPINNQMFGANPFGIGYDNNIAPEQNERLVASSIVDTLTVTEIINLYDAIGVTICDPNYTGSTWANDYGADIVWETFFANQSGWESYPQWDENRGVWTGGVATACAAMTNLESPITIESYHDNIGITIIQNTPLLSWNIMHFLNRFPIVRVYNTSGIEILPLNIEHVSNQGIIITFSEPTAGVVRLV
jgi:hypothetical protein